MTSKLVSNSEMVHAKVASEHNDLKNCTHGQRTYFQQPDSGTGFFPMQFLNKVPSLPRKCIAADHARGCSGGAPGSVRSGADRQGTIRRISLLQESPGLLGLDIIFG